MAILNGTDRVHGNDRKPDVSIGQCKRSCCWTQYGHSTVRDQIPAGHRDACRCHNEEKEAA